jgi:hypothetical protein
MHGIQIFIPGWGFLCLAHRAQKDFLTAGYGYINDFNNYQSSSTTPFFIGYPT